MFDTKLRPVSNQVLEPLARPLAGTRPDSITVFGGVVGVIAAVLAAVGIWPLAVVAWLANRVLDGVDGIVARFTTPNGTDAGGYLDMTVDVAVYALIPLGVAIGVDTKSAWIAAAFLLASFYFNTITWTYLAAVMEKLQVTEGQRVSGHGSTSIVMPRGLVEGAETTLLFVILLLSPLIGPTWPVAVMAVMAVLVVVGGLARLISGRRALQ